MRGKREAQEAPSSDSLWKPKAQQLRGPSVAWGSCHFLTSRGSCWSQPPRQGCGPSKSNRASGRELMGPLRYESLGREGAWPWDRHWPSWPYFNVLFGLFIGKHFILLLLGSRQSFPWCKLLYSFLKMLFILELCPRNFFSHLLRNQEE